MDALQISGEDKATFAQAMGRLRVLLVYEDFSTGLRARQAFEEVASQLEMEADFRVDLWKFDLLREPALREGAANEAAQADIVFLSAHNPSDLPGTVELWLQQWLERRGGKPCALVVLLDNLNEDAETTQRTLDALRTQALAAGVDVFVHAAEAFPTEEHSILDEIRRHPVARTTQPAELFHGFDLHPYRDWGINE